MSRAVTALLRRWWVAVLAVYLGARAVSAAILLVVAQTQAETPWTPARPSYPDFTGAMWDSSWYREIAEQGYPAGLPIGADGVAQSAWAFFPLYPALVRGLMSTTGGSWVVLAPLVSLVLGAVAMLVVHAVVADALPDAAGRVRRHAPLLTVALLSTAASAPVLQVAYTEATALLALAVGLWAVQRERYALAALAVAALGMTRAVALPFALVAVVHGLVRWRSGRPFPARQRVAVGALAGLSVAAALAWPYLVGLLTGTPNAFRMTQAAWRGRGDVVWLWPWLDVATWLLGWWAVPVLVALAALLVAGLASRPLRRLGPELHAWTIGYAGFLVAVVEPGTSLVRFALLAFPAWAALATAVLGTRRPRAWAAALVGLGMIGQAAWIALLWRLVPPSGWPP